MFALTLLLALQAAEATAPAVRIDNAILRAAPRPGRTLPAMPR